jgi:hypothetical protein
MSLRRRAVIWLLVGWLAGAGHARAFSDPASFSDPVHMGGGGRRYFTGSARDGYGCNVCHAGGKAAEVVITGLPLAGYQPGTAYEARVEWPASLEHLGLMLEITDRNGVQAGELRLPPPGELPNEERCEPFEDGFGAGEIIQSDQRSLLSVADCGAKRVRFLWIAPREARGALRFSGGLVASDGEADAAGDAATQFAHELPMGRGTGALASDIHGGCGATPRSAAAPSTLLLMVLALGLLLWRQRRNGARPCER